MFENLPKVKKAWVDEHALEMQKKIAVDTPAWLNETLGSLSNENKDLYDYVTTRSRILSNAVIARANATQNIDPFSLSVSIGIELIMLLHLLNLSFDKEGVLKSLDEKLTNLFGKDKIKGYDDL